MLSIKYSLIPSYLRNSAFYRTLNDEEPDSEIQIPSECFKLDDSVTNLTELSQMLLVERFWCLDQLPWALMDYYYRLDDPHWHRHELDEYPALFDMSQVFTEKRPLNEVMTSCHRPELVSFLIKVSSPEDASATRTAASLGRLDYLMALYEHGYDWDERTCSTAAEGGHLECLKFACENDCPWDEYTMINAAHNGHLDCLKYAFEQGLEWEPDVCTVAAENGHLNCLQYAIANGCMWNEGVTLEAAAGGFLDCLRFALENGCLIHDYACYNAAQGGHLDCLALLHLVNAPWSETVPARTAANGHLTCLQYLHENGCPWNASTTEAAAVDGNEDCLRYAISHGCAYTAICLKIAVDKGSLPCLKYLIGELGMYMDVDGSLFVEAMKCGVFCCLQYLIDVGCPLGNFTQGDELYDFGYDRMFDATFDVDNRDRQLWQCIDYAVHHGWRWNEVFVEYVRRNKKQLPTCWARVNDDV